MSNVTSEKTAFVIDTNVAMHFSRLDQIDWLQVAGAREVELVICAIFIAELEKHKTDHSSKKLRKRAGEYATWLARQFDEPVIRKGVTLRFLPNEPMLDYKAHGLDPNTADDRLIAATLELGQAVPELSIGVMTADLGLTLKLRTRGIAVLSPPESTRLRDELTDEELEVRELRKQLANYTNRLPRPIITFVDGEIVLCIERRNIIDRSAYIGPRMGKVREKFPKIGQTEFPDLGNTPLATQIGSTFRNMTTTLDQAYDTDVDRYLREYELYLQDCYEYGLRAAALREIRLCLSNFEGTAPATKVDIFVTCDGPATLSDTSEVGKLPTAPDKPRKRELFSAMSDRPTMFNPPRFHTFEDALKRADPTRDRLTVDSGEASFYVHQLKHRQSQDLQAVWLDFGSVEKLCGMTLRYEIHTDETLDPIKGSLQVKVVDAQVPAVSSD